MAETVKYTIEEWIAFRQKVAAALTAAGDRRKDASLLSSADKLLASGAISEEWLRG